MRMTNEIYHADGNYLRQLGRQVKADLAFAKTDPFISGRVGCRLRDRARYMASQENPEEEDPGS